MSTTSSLPRRRRTTGLTSPPHLTPAPGRLETALAWAPTLLWAAVIFQLSSGTFSGSFTAWVLEQFFRLLHLSVSRQTFEVIHFLLRKSAHLTEYAIFSVLLYHSLSSPRAGEWQPRKALLAVVTAGLYSLTDEYHQLFAHGRTASLLDCGIDTLGAALAMLSLYANALFFHARSRSSAARSASPVERKKGAEGE